ncbi:hypothetical protein ACOSQ4_001068 [Xanthoceras sorbifolium]
MVNNAAVNGVIWDSDAFVKAFEAAGGWPGGESYNWNELAIQNFEVAEECLKINYYGAKRMIEAHISLLQLSDSARMVNVIINFRDINERSITKRAVRISTLIMGDIYSHVRGKCTNHFTKSRYTNYLSF